MSYYSGNPTQLRQNAESLAFFSKSNAAWFKFVITEDKDIDEVESLVTQFRLPNDRILLMPEGRDQTTLEQRRIWLADTCKSLNYRFSDRLHVHLWGAKRGV